MKKVLVALDFNDQAIHTLDFALRFFNESKILILHVRPSSDLSIINTASKLEEKQFWNIRMKEFLIAETSMRLLPKNVKIAIAYGSIAAQINLYAEQNNFDKIVVGRRSHYSVASKFIGTHTNALIKKSKKEIYTVPFNYEYSKCEKVLVASDSEFNNTNSLKKLAEWSSDQNVFLSFLHVKDDLEDDFEDGKEVIIDQYLADQSVSKGFDISVLSGPKIAEKILAQAYQKKADMLVVFPSKNALFKNLFLKSVSKEILEKSALPIAFL